MMTIRRFACALILATLVAGSVRHASAANLDDETFLEVATYVLGNVNFTLFHEFGHAIVHGLDLPILGREEDAVDNLAAFLMIPEPGNDLMDEMIIAAADGWLLSHYEAEELGIEIPYWGEHGLDLQRYYNIICLLYGSDPHGFEELADFAELPAERRDRCPEEYQQVVTSWTKVLEPHRTGGNKRPSVINVHYQEPAAQHRRLTGLLTESGIVTSVSKTIGESIHFPNPPRVTVKSCGVANAFFDPSTNEITLCYDLVEEFERQVLADIARDSDPAMADQDAADARPGNDDGAIMILKKSN